MTLELCDADEYQTLLRRMVEARAQIRHALVKLADVKRSDSPQLRSAASLARQHLKRATTLLEIEAER